MSTQKLATAASRQINAVVVSAGLMQKTVKVRIGQQKWNAHIKKHFNRNAHLLVHDPASSLRTGDVISISPGFRASKHVRHVVNSILAPFGDPIEDRPSVPTEEERLAAMAEKKARRNDRILVKRQLASGFVRPEPGTVVEGIEGVEGVEGVVNEEAEAVEEEGSEKRVGV